MNPSMVLLTFCAAGATYLTGVGLWDWHLYTDGVKRNSITQSIIDVSLRKPFIAAFIGYFIGGLSIGLMIHFFDSIPQCI